MDVSIVFVLTFSLIVREHPSPDYEFSPKRSLGLCPQTKILPGFWKLHFSQRKKKPIKAALTRTQIQSDLTKNSSSRWSFTYSSILQLRLISFWRTQPSRISQTRTTSLAARKEEATFGEVVEGKQGL